VLRVPQGNAFQHLAGFAMTQNLDAIRRFLLGGQAIFTIVSKKSGDRKTYRVRAGEDVDGSGIPHGWYVDLLIGPNNTEDYRYLAYMWRDQVVGSLPRQAEQAEVGERESHGI
jgi:hypothetical protein